MVEEHYIILLHDVVLPMLVYASLYPNLLLGLILLIVFNFADLSADELGLEMRVDLPCSLRCSGPLFYEPGAHLGRTSCVKLLQPEYIAAVLQKNVELALFEPVHLHEFQCLLLAIIIPDLHDLILQESREDHNWDFRVFLVGIFHKLL